jgi:hypothetical protein
MFARRYELLFRCATLLAAALCLPLFASAQWDARPAGRLAALTSGPVAVPLVATLQSLSVSASPAALPLAAAHGISPTLTVTTAWTIRANCTTLRLSGNSGALAAFDRDPLTVSPSDKTGRAVPLAASPLPRNDTDWPGIVQPVGPASYPGSRTDNAAFVIDRNGNSTSAAPASPVYILAQAL